MGTIRITLDGSFRPDGTKQFSAEPRGHAHALATAASWLLERLPAAIHQDHRLHGENAYPVAGFGRPWAARPLERVIDRSEIDQAIAARGTTAPAAELPISDELLGDGVVDTLTELGWTVTA